MTDKAIIIPCTTPASEDEPQPPRKSLTSPQKSLAQDAEFLTFVADQIELVQAAGDDGVDGVDQNLLAAIDASGKLYPLTSAVVRAHFNTLADRYTGGDPLGFLTRAGHRQVCEFLAGKAHRFARTRTLYKRSAFVDGAIWIDLTDPDGRCIKITAEGWSLTTPAEPMFQRLPGQRPLPVPVAADDGEAALRRLVPPGLGDDDIKLLITALLGFKIPANFTRSFSYPILAITGESGAGKSTLAKLICELTDNQATTVAARPSKVDDVYVAAQTRHLLSYDNVDAIRGGLSDAFCALTTGAAVEKRTLYTNGARTTLAAHNPILLNGIAPDLPRQDFLDRTITLHLQRLTPFDPDAGRSATHDLPIVQGYLCDLLVTALANLPTTTLRESPRLSLVAKIATAARIPGSTASVVELLAANQREALIATQEHNPLIDALIHLLRKTPHWTGSVGQLLAELSNLSTEAVVKSRAWPAIPRQLSEFLREHTRLFAALGIEVVIGARIANGRQVHLRRTDTFVGADPTL